MTPRTFVIGDVHGCLGALNALVDTLAPVRGDRFAFLGDLVDKGPDSLGALRMVRSLVERFPGSFSVAGNHEESALRLKAKADKAGSWAGIDKATREPWLVEATAADFAFMRSMPLVGRPVDGVITVHGGFFPSFFVNHGGIGEVPSDWHKGGGKRMERMRRFLRIRHVTRDAGEMVSLGGEGDNSIHWSDWWDGREGFVFFGHDPTDGLPRWAAHATGMDTGAVFGAKLSAAVLLPGQNPRDAEIVSTSSVKCAERLRLDDE